RSFSRVRTMFPVVVHWRPDSNDQLVVRMRPDCGGHIILVRIYVTFMTAEPNAIEPGIGVVISCPKLQAETFAREVFRHLKMFAIPPPLVTDPRRLGTIDFGRLQPLSMSAPRNFYSPPAMGRRSGPFFAPGEFPITIKRNGLWNKRSGRCRGGIRGNLR